MATREPRPKGTEPTAGGPGSRSVAKTAVRSSKAGRSAGGSAGPPFTVSTWIREGWRSLRRAGRTGTAELVAGAELAAPDLGRGDVHVVAGVHRRVHAHEAAAVGQDVEHAGGDLLLGHRLVHHLGLLLAGGSLVLRLLVLGAESRPRAPRPRAPRRARSRRAPPRRAAPFWPRRMASTSSALRLLRKPSTPSSDAMAWRSASGLSSSSLRWSTGTRRPTLLAGSGAAPAGRGQVTRSTASSTSCMRRVSE